MTQEPQELPSTAYLVIQQGREAGKRLELCKDYTTIGRSRDCDIFLEDVTVHRKQASIVYTDAGFVLRDDHGSGDSIVNGRTIKEQLLNDGDQLLFGNSRLTFFAQEATRPIPFASSRGHELHLGRRPDLSAGIVARLELTNMRGGVQSFELQAETTIGRSRDCDIFLEDLPVSRLHAIIRQQPDGIYELADQHSATGTFVNGQPIIDCRLKEGDVVQIGANSFTFRLSRS